MTSRIRRQLSLTVFAITALAAGWVILAQPVRDRIIDSALIEPNADHVFLNIALTLPFRYLSHVPLDTGSEVRIRIRPVQVPTSDRGAVFEREAVVPPDGDVALVDIVVYEGDAPDGPWLTVRFSHPVRFQVIPRADYRSITIDIQEILP
jgi:hypothetical protein